MKKIRMIKSLIAEQYELIEGHEYIILSERENSNILYIEDEKKRKVGITKDNAGYYFYYLD